MGKILLRNGGFVHNTKINFDLKLESILNELHDEKYYCTSYVFAILDFVEDIGALAIDYIPDLRLLASKTENQTLKTYIESTLIPKIENPKVPQYKYYNNSNHTSYTTYSKFGNKQTKKINSYKVKITKKTNNTKGLELNKCHYCKKLFLPNLFERKYSKYIKNTSCGFCLSNKCFRLKSVSYFSIKNLLAYIYHAKVIQSKVLFVSEFKDIINKIDFVCQVHSICVKYDYYNFNFLIDFTDIDNGIIPIESIYENIAQILYSSGIVGWMNGHNIADFFEDIISKISRRDRFIEPDLGILIKNIPISDYSIYRVKEIDIRSFNFNSIQT